ncbi:competence protein ComEA [Cupriavidus gilardii J11]|uniref:Competence protein ComEA n=1 Tax=Cupriavidus gilardii J11 TaxID=936133 RepID=A0A562B2M5_9BURK|nr:helix-hairpin-helix domain-containing protein [Cupriavidus gilardii]TWG79487.1 competence protein ComEA [Cupriavidus gilardii J11]
MIKRILPALACCAGLLSAPFGTALAAVDVNQADEAALTTFKGVGPAMARRILEERGKQGAFKDADDLAQRVKGLGPRLVARLQTEGLTIGKAGPPSNRKPGTAAARKDRVTVAAGAGNPGASKALTPEPAGKGARSVH